jgi:hypothetical protein
MRRIVPLIWLAVSLAAHAKSSRPVSIQEFEQILASNSGEPDGKVAKDLSGLRLTERASSVRLARWESEFPGKHCHEELLLLADASAFLNLPAADTPANAVPAVEAQKAILLKAQDRALSGHSTHHGGARVAPWAGGAWKPIGRDAR